jgi:two-component system response regulator PilR (NtrC family)
VFNILLGALALSFGVSVDAADLAWRATKPVARCLVGLPPPASTPAALPTYIEDLERKAIEEALQANRYNKTKAAAALGITFRALRYKLKKLGID